MQIEEIIHSCRNEHVARAAVACIGHKFLAEIESAATVYGMTAGTFVALSVDRFARHGDEAELRAVRTAMRAAQEPILAGLHRILCIMLAVGTWSETRRLERAPLARAARIEHLEIAARFDYAV